MTRKKKTILALAGAAALLVAGLLLYVTISDLSGWRDTAARFASNALDRELTISGEFSVDLGFVTRVKATEIRLANPEWASEPVMARLGRVDVTIDLQRLFGGSIHIPSIEVDDGRVLFESDPELGSNWALGAASDDTESAQIDLRIDTIQAQNVELVVRSSTEEPDWDLVVSSLVSTSGDEGALELDAVGELRGMDFALSGTAGPLNGFVNQTSIVHDLKLRLGTTEISSAGTVADLAALRGIDLRTTVDAPEPDEITSLLGLPDTPLQGVTGTIDATTRSGLTNFALSVVGAALELRAEGSVDSLTAPADLVLDLRLEGPDIRPIASLAGVEGLPADPVNVSGKLRWQGFPIELEALEVTVGNNSVTASGHLGAPPQMLETDFRFEATGPSIATFGALAGVELPVEAFDVRGRLLRVERGVAIEDVDARIGQATLELSGTVGDPPSLTGTDLRFAAVVPTVSTYSRLVGVNLPAERFEASGRLAPEGDRVVLEGVKARLGANTLSADGGIATTEGLVGTDIRLQAAGPDLSLLAAVAEVEGLPSAPFEVEGRVQIESRGYRLNGFSGRLADLTMAADGLISNTPELVGTDLQLQAEGPDVSWPAALAGLTGIPRDSFSVRGRVQLVGNGYRIEGVEARLADLSATVEGMVGPMPDLAGTELRIEARGERLTTIGPYLDQSDLPAAPFAVSGGVAVEETSYRLETVVAELGRSRLEVGGIVIPAPGLTGTNLEFVLSGETLREVGRFAAGFFDLPELPAEPYSVTAGVAIDDAGYEIRDLRAALGNATATARGRLGPLPDLHGTDLTINADGPNASLFTALTGVSVPVAPFQVDGRVERLADGFRFHNLRARLGGFSARANGRLGEPPRLVGTDLEVEAEGPSLALIADLAGVPELPDEPFRVEGRFEGDPRSFEAERLSARLGASDVAGSFRIDLEGKPRMQAELRSARFDVRELLKSPESGDKPGTADPEQAPVAEATQPEKKRGPVISDEPFDFSALQQVDAELQWAVEELVMPANSFKSFQLTLQLEDGHLHVDPISAVGTHGGVLSGSFALEPMASDYRLQSDLRLDNARLQTSESVADPSEWPELDISVKLDAVGASPHAIAAASNGRIELIIGEGVMDNSLVDLVVADVLLEVLSLLNPFSKEEAVTRLQCGVVVVNVEDGVVVFAPMAVQTDKMTMLGSGEVDLETEELDLEWVTKPRKGIGLSASAITNPYIKLGGTLADPSIEMKPLEAVTSTGIAVATGGLSILGKGLFDRITAEKKVCEQAMKRAAKQLQPAQPKREDRRR